MGKIVNRYKKLLNISIGFEVLDIIVGLLLFLYSDFASRNGSLLVGALLIVHGLLCLIRYFYDGLGSKVFSTDLSLGVIGIIAGLFAFSNILDSFDSAGILYGIWLLACGIHKGYYALKLMKKNDEIYPLLTVISILIIVMGVVVLLKPLRMYMLITKLIGIFAVGTALLELVSMFLCKKRSDVMLDLIK